MAEACDVRAVCLGTQFCRQTTSCIEENVPDVCPLSLLFLLPILQSCCAPSVVKWARLPRLHPRWGP